MKYIFVVNPAAGTQSAVDAVKAAMVGRNDCELYVSPAPRVATKYIAQRCEAEPDAQLRFIACGGDGTINEVVSGAAGYPNASVGIYPCGSGNDLVRVYGGQQVYADFNACFSQKEQLIDLLRVNDRWCINCANFGFDSYAARVMAKVKKKPIIGGRNAYTTGIVRAVFGGMRTYCRVRVDGELIHTGDIMLCTVANGVYIGGGYKCAPRAMLDDGYAEVCLVHPVGALRIPELIGIYRRGEHLDNPKLANIITYRRGKCIEVEGNDDFFITLDGEAVPGSSFKIDVVPKALRLAIPE